VSGSRDPGIDASLLQSLPRRRLSGPFWHQGSPSRPLLSFASPAAGDGRYHRDGDPGAWYASSKEGAAWAELLRHSRSGGPSSTEVRRKIGRVRVEELEVLDLTDPDMRRQLGVSVRDLTGEDRSLCQEIASAARSAGFDGILAPSAAVRGERTLVVFPSGTSKIREEHSRIQRSPAHIR
jgi:RES domain-containing protein